MIPYEATIEGLDEGPAILYLEKNTQHTPGPWMPRSWGQTVSIDAPEIMGIAFINPGGNQAAGIPSAQDRANARLIAAAPELLFACHRALSVFYALAEKRGGMRGADEDEAVTQLRAAIHQAIGK